MDSRWLVLAPAGVGSPECRTGAGADRSPWAVKAGRPSTIP